MEKVPEGYMRNSQGHLVPVDQVREIDQMRDNVVRELIAKAAETKNMLTAFKMAAMDEIKTFISLSAERYNIKWGGKKGNVSLTTYDGEYRVLIAVSETIFFDERLQIAKELIDECIMQWSEGSRSEIRALVNMAFKVDKAGKINTNSILSLRQLEISDPKWTDAMNAISESIQVSGSKEYIRFYRRDKNDSYVPIPLDIAAL